MVRQKQAKKALKAQDASKADTELARSVLFASVEGDDDDDEINDVHSPRPFLRLFVSSNITKSIKAGISVREQRQLLLGTIEKFNKAHARRFFASLQNIVKKVIDNEAYIPESAYQEEEEEGGEEVKDRDEDIIPDVRSSENLQFLNYAALAVRAYLDGQAERHAPKQTQLALVGEAFEIAQSLHNILFSLNSCGPDAVEPQSTIVSLCESWWKNNGEQKEHLIVQALPLIVFAALGEGEAIVKSNVKRLFQMRETLHFIDFADPSSDWLRSLLSRVASSPLCLLKQQEGKRFLAYLFQIDGILVKDLHQSIRVQIPDAKKNVLEAYGEIYFRAWKEAPEAEIREYIENQALSDLIYAVIHVASPNMVKSLLTVLEPFHDTKKTPQVEGLLHRMYGPILWRSLAAANAKVRVNAAQILAQVFPLQDASHTQTEQAVRKGCTALKSLLQDRDPRVRVAGSKAMATILSTYWDVLPPEDIRALLNHIVAEYASDASSSAVRAAAVNAVTLLLKAPQSHAVLRALLPPLGNLIHDKVEKVRLAVVRMLFRIKTVPGIKYYHVVPFVHLTARLAEEGRRNTTGPVASALTALMANSYFPQGPNVTGVQQIKRTLTFLSNDPVAAAVFYANLSEHLSVVLVAKLAAMLLRCLNSAVEKEQQNEKQEAGGRKRRCFGKQASDDDDEEEEKEKENVESDSLLSALDTSLMASLAETICTLWQSIEVHLQNSANEKCNQFLIDSFSGPTLTNALTHFERKALQCELSGADDAASTREDCYRTCSAILRLAGRLPAKAVEGLVPHISSILASLSECDGDSDTPRQNVSAHIALLCLWDMTEEVAPSLARSIEAAFSGGHELNFASPAPNSRKRRSGRQPKKDEKVAVPQLPPRVALDVLGDILRGSDPSSVAARESILASPSATLAIEKALERGTKYAERLLVDSVYSQSMVESEVDYILRVCEACGRFALHKEASSNASVNFSTQAEQLLQWTTQKVVLAFTCSHRNDTTPFNDPDLSRISIEKSFDSSLPLSPIPTGPPKRRPNRNKTPTRFDDTTISNTTTDIDEQSGSSMYVARAFAVSLMQSSCVIMAEWLAVGGAGAEDITKSSVMWASIFELEGGTESQKELLPAFSRLAIQLCKTAQNFSLLNKLLLNCSEETDTDEDGPIRAALSSLLSMRGNQGPAIVMKTVQCILDASHELIKSKDIAMDNELPTSIGTVWPADKGCIAVALRSILSSKQASLECCKQIVESFGEKVGQSTDSALFDAKCLWMLCDSDNKASSEAINMVRRLDLDGLEEDSDARTVVEELLDGLA